MKIKMNIKEIREQKGITVRELSSRCGISVGALSRYENVQRSPTLEQLQKIAIALGVKITELFDCEEK